MSISNFFNFISNNIVDFVSGSTAANGVSVTELADGSQVLSNLPELPPSVNLTARLGISVILALGLAANFRLRHPDMRVNNSAIVMQVGTAIAWLGTLCYDSMNYPSQQMGLCYTAMFSAGIFAFATLVLARDPD